jgi:nitrate reductase NapAB chaperone NapD
MPSDQSTMNSNLKFYLDKEDQNLHTGIEIYETLGTINQVIDINILYHTIILQKI